MIHGSYQQKKKPNWLKHADAWVASKKILDFNYITTQHQGSTVYFRRFYWGAGEGHGHTNTFTYEGGNFEN